MPRSVGDFFTGFLLVFPVQALALLILPGLVAFLLSRSWFVALIPPIIIYFAVIIFTVWSILLTPEGIRFRRLFGVPKFLPWSSISTIEVVTQRELVTKGWLWPLLPAREMTASLSSVRHYRISWHGGYCYYPPADTEAFEQHVRGYMAGHAKRDTE